MALNLKEKLNKLADYLFVNDYKCIICNREIVKNSRYSMCNSCLKKLPYITHSCNVCGGSIKQGNLCLNCKHTLPSVTKNISVFDYSAPLDNLVYGLKYGNKKYLAKYLSNLMVDKFLESKLDIDFIIPVPMHKVRLTERGYNQAELLCISFKDVKLEIKDNIVERIVNTVSQASLPREKRLVNLTNVFKITDKKSVKNKNILIIDDVYTTGTTVSEIAKVLMKAGAKKVYSLTLCHSVYETPLEPIK